MKLQQLRYIYEISRRHLSVSAAAKAMNASQPGVSNQVQLLETELGLQIFKRRGKRLTEVTPIGQKVLGLADKILRDAENIQQLAADNRDDKHGTLSIATTHTQARYALPKAIKSFAKSYPEVHLNMVQGTPNEIAEMVLEGKVDLAIATEGLQQYDTLSVLPCYEWNRALILPPEHPLAAEKELTLEAISKYPILTYMMGFTGRENQDKAFTDQGITPNVVFTATDADVIKTYVELELGIGIIAAMAFDPERDTPLLSRDVSHLFEPSTTHIGLRKGNQLRGFTYAFIALFAPHLTRSVVEAE